VHLLYWEELLEVAQLLCQGLTVLHVTETQLVPRACGPSDLCPPRESLQHRPSQRGHNFHAAQAVLFPIYSHPPLPLPRSRGQQWQLLPHPRYSPVWNRSVLSPA